MSRKRIMLVGPTGCGKTALAQVLDGTESTLRKTQTITYGKYTIDIPGSYIENTGMYKHLIATAQQASCLLLLADPTHTLGVYSPGFTKAFRIPVIGVITKSDLKEYSPGRCSHQLKLAGVTEPYFHISVFKDTGIEVLKAHLEIVNRHEGGAV